MKDQYVGDVGDFGKYGLLRALTGTLDETIQPQLSLGVNWYLTPDDLSYSYGSSRDYLEKASSKECDPLLHAELKDLKIRGQRTVREIEARSLLGNGVAFYRERLRWGDVLSMDARLDFRKKWVATAIERLRARDLIFLDPDKGLEIKSKKRNHREGPMYVYLDEIGPWINAGSSVVVYAHFSRNEKGVTYLQQAKRRAMELSSLLPQHGSVWCLKYSPRGGRAFYILARPDLSSMLASRVQNFLNGPWSCTFEQLAHKSV